MSELTDKLEKIIQQAALDGALTEDAVAQFHTLVQERNALKEANIEWEENDKKTKKEIETLSKQYSEMHSQVGVFNARIDELEKREKECHELEIRKECAEERVKDHKEMFKLVFRNSVLRREVMSPSYDFQEPSGTQRSSYPVKNDVEEEEK